MKISEMITDRYKLRIPPTVYYELLADVQELEEKQEPKFIAKSDGTIEQIKNCNDCLFKNEWKKIGKLLSVVLEKQTEQEPTTKNDLVTLTFSKGILKYSCKDYVVYKRDWLRSHYGAEIDIMFGDSQYKEPTTKNDLGVDAVSRQAVIELMMQKWGENFSGDDAMQESIDAIRVMPSVTPQELRWIPCSKRLPKFEYGESDSVLVCFENKTQDVLYFNGSNWCYPTGETYISVNHKNDWHNKVIAWMPLSQSYKAESEA